jgi:hypothetical protein
MISTMKCTTIEYKKTMKKYQQRIIQIEYTLEVLGRILKDTNDRIKSSTDKLDELYEDMTDLHDLTLEQATYMRSIDKDEHMKFYIKKEYDRLDKLHTELSCIEDE